MVLLFVLNPVIIVVCTNPLCNLFDINRDPRNELTAEHKMLFACEPLGKNPRIDLFNRYEHNIVLVFVTKEELLIIIIEVNSMVEFFEHCS